MHLAHVTMSTRIFASCETVGAGGWGRYGWHFAIAAPNAGALTDTPLIEIVSPFDCWPNDLTPKAPLPGGPGKFGAPLARAPGEPERFVVDLGLARVEADAPRGPRTPGGA
jgi:hypothetical protein